MRISDWSSDVCSSDLVVEERAHAAFELRRGDQSIDLLGDPAPTVQLTGCGRPQQFRIGRRIDQEIAQPRGFRIAVEFVQAILVWTGQGLIDAQQKIRRHHHAGERELQTARSEEHTSELQSLMRISYAVFCLNKKTK